MRGPFGLSPYSTPSADEATFLVRFNYVSQPHPDFVEYHGVWQPEVGLTRIYAHSRKFDEDDNGYKTFELYLKIKQSLLQRYGEPASNENAIEKDERISEIHYENASCVSMWSFPGKSTNQECIERIVLMVCTDSYECSYVSLDYEYQNSAVPRGDKFETVL